jgi:UDP-3-O-[3-hydroxymyristoyl] glucosamine N-acyltransferase
MSHSKSYTLAEIAEKLGVKVHGNPNHEIQGIAALNEAALHQISFLDNPKYQPQLLNTKAGAVILAEKYLADCPTNAIISEHPYVTYAKAAQLFWHKPEPYIGIHPSAIIDETAFIGKDVNIGPFAVIGRRTKILDGAIIGAHCVVSDDCEIGEDTELMPRVTLYHEVSVGAQCLIHSGVVLGSDGFGFAPSKEGYEKIPQLGGVKVGDKVEIGANTTIDRGALSDTVIAKGVKLDNQIQIGHNVKIGENTVIAGCTGIAGSTEIGSNCMIGGGSCINGHIKITDQVMLLGMTGVINSINAPGVYGSATPLLPRTEWQKVAVRIRQLNDLAKTVQTLKKDQNHTD